MGLTGEGSLPAAKNLSADRWMDHGPGGNRRTWPVRLATPLTFRTRSYRLDT
jgi:hypothetical protein